MKKKTWKKWFHWKINANNRHSISTKNDSREQIRPEENKSLLDIYAISGQELDRQNMSRQQLPNNDEIVEHFNQQKLQSGLVVGGCWGDHETGKSRSRKKNSFSAILPPVKIFKNIWNKFSWKHHLLYRLAGFYTQIFRRKGYFDPYCPHQIFLNDKKTFQQQPQNIWQHFTTSRVAKCHGYKKYIGVKKW